LVTTTDRLTLGSIGFPTLRVQRLQ